MTSFLRKTIMSLFLSFPKFPNTKFKNVVENYSDRNNKNKHYDIRHHLFSFLSCKYRSCRNTAAIPRNVPKMIYHQLCSMKTNTIRYPSPAVSTNAKNPKTVRMSSPNQKSMFLNLFISQAPSIS